jgi:Ca-activated chloride channel family protein
MSEPKLELNLERDFENLFTGKSTDCILEIHLKAPQRQEPGQRAPVNVALVIDRSGSMSGLKLDYAKRASLYALDLLSEIDKAALIAFDHSVTTYFPCVPLDSRNKSLLKSAVTELMVGGNTNLSGGWLRGCQLIGEVLDPTAVQRCILLTDGMANHGITGVDELSMHATELFRRGVSTSTFGVGDDYDERLLEAMANHGGGRYYYIANPQDIPAIFEQEFEGLTRLTARNIRLQITLPVGASARVVGDWRHEDQGQETSVHVNDLSAEQEVFIYLQISFPSQSEGAGAGIHVSACAEGENSVQLETEMDLQYVYAADPIVKSQPVHIDMVKRFKRVEAAVEIEKALRLEKEGKRQEASHQFNQYFNHAAPMMDADDARNYSLKARNLHMGMSESDRKLEHLRSYTDRQSRREQVNQIFREKMKDPKSNPTEPGTGETEGK